MKASRVLVSCLENEGVQRIFGIPGEENMDVMDGLADSSIEFILTKHENSAAYMAGMQARLTNQPGVCLSTLGPGATNMVNGVADAFLSNLPLIALCGQAGQNRMDPPQKQVIDLVSLYKPVTKESYSVRGPSTVPLLVRKAFDTARRERPGPVMLELPEDVMRQDCGESPIPVCPIVRARHESSGLNRIAEVLNQAERPLTPCRSRRRSGRCGQGAQGVRPFLEHTGGAHLDGLGDNVVRGPSVPQHRGDA